jgi:hypothetical protein
MAVRGQKPRFTEKREGFLWRTQSEDRENLKLLRQHFSIKAQHIVSNNETISLAFKFLADAIVKDDDTFRKMMMIEKKPATASVEPPKGE